MANNGKRGATDNGDGDSERAERYKQAATEALEMIDWSIGFLVGSHKEKIAGSSPETASTFGKI